MANIDELFGGFDEPIGFDESGTTNPVVIDVDEIEENV